MTGPNVLWTTDFKGKFLTGDRRYCHPLTVADYSSRYLLRCEGKRSEAGAGAFPVFEDLFRAKGLPEAILSDNGQRLAVQLDPSGRALAAFGVLPMFPALQARHPRSTPPPTPFPIPAGCRVW